jgi:hypothetical protein
LTKPVGSKTSYCLLLKEDTEQRDECGSDHERDREKQLQKSLSSPPKNKQIIYSTNTAHSSSVNNMLSFTKASSATHYNTGHLFFNFIFK